MKKNNWRGRGGWGWKNHWKNKNKYATTSRTDTNSVDNSITPSTSTTTNRAPANQAPITIFINEGDNKIWKLYFPQEEYSTNSEIHKRVETVKQYIEKNRSLFDLEKIDRTRSVPLDVQSMCVDSDFTSGWPNFTSELNEKPEPTLRILEFALHESLNCEFKIRARILNHQTVIPLSNLKVNYFGKMVTIKGTVIRVGSINLISTSVAFECNGCHVVQVVSQPQGVFTTPSFCSNCRNMTKFDTLLSSPYTITNDWQTAKIQEIQSLSASGTIPRSVEVELQDDLVGTACPGDVLSVTGIVQVRSESKGGESEGGRSARLLQLYIEAVSVHAQRNLTAPSLAFTLTDYYAIREIHASNDVFRLLVHSLCPSIFGHEIVKAGLILGLMGGTEVDRGPRSNPHILMVGDPGLGKSQLLQAAAHAAPRGVYVCGASSSAGGLTVSLSREAGSEFALEAGALILADGGVCCIDELDKMTSQHGSLLEAMEQRTVSIAKAGVVCSLSARATVLSAANPIRGHYDKSKTVAENLKINTALLSRFDLVFILVDKPDEKMDAMLSEHVLALHAGRSKTKRCNDPSTSHNNNSLHDNTDELSLNDRLRLKPREEIDSLPTILLRKYIAYARRYVHPKLSKEAAETLQQFYLELRRTHQDDGTPITTRQLEACVRLTQARARAELREEATSSDACDVIAIMKHSLIDTFSDELGNIQLSRSINGSGVSGRSKVKRFLEIINRRANQTGKDVFTKQELQQLHSLSNIGGNSSEFIEQLHTHSYLLYKGYNTYQILSM